MTVTAKSFAMLDTGDAVIVYYSMVDEGQKGLADYYKDEYLKQHPEVGADAFDTRPAATIRGGAAAGSGGGGGGAFGWVVALAGVALVATAFLLSSDIGSEVVNLDKLNLKLMLCVFGSALVISGSLGITRSVGR